MPLVITTRGNFFITGFIANAASRKSVYWSTCGGLRTEAGEPQDGIGNVRCALVVRFGDDFKASIIGADECGEIAEGRE